MDLLLLFLLGLATLGLMFAFVAACERVQKGRFMIVLAIIATVFLFAYLLAALLRPEWF